MTNSNEAREPRSTAELAYGRNERSDNGETAPQPGSPNLANEDQAPLLRSDQSQGYSSRWQDVQAEFVDEPQKAVRDADGLVAEVIQSLAASFADQRKGLEDQWSKGSEVSTEDLRQALMQYRSFFQRLLAHNSARFWQAGLICVMRPASRKSIDEDLAIVTGLEQAGASQHAHQIELRVGDAPRVRGVRAQVVDGDFDHLVFPPSFSGIRRASSRSLGWLTTPNCAGERLLDRD